MGPTIPPHLPGRIVVCGNKLKRSIVSNSAGIYNFQRAFQLDQEEVSHDHTSGALAGTKAQLTQAAGLPLSVRGAQGDKGPKGGFGVTACPHREEMHRVFMVFHG